MTHAQGWIDASGLDVTSRGEVFSVDLPVRWGDMDAQGHVNNGVYLDYLQDARVDFLVAGGEPSMLEQGVLAVKHTIEYRAPITYSDRPVQVLLVMLERRLARFRVGYLIIHDEVLCAVASSTMVAFDIQTQRPRRLTTPEVDLFDRHLWSIRRPFRDLPRPALAERGHVTPVLTRWSDVDRFNHVNNVRMLDYFQEARIALTTEADPTAARLGSAGSPEGRSLWLVARQDIEYVNQMSFRRTPYPLHTVVTRIGNTSLTLAAEILDPETGNVVSRAQHVLVCADANLRPRPVSDAMRAHVQRYLIDA